MIYCCRWAEACHDRPAIPAWEDGASSCPEVVVDNLAIARFLGFCFLVGAVVGAAIGLREEHRNG